MEPDTQPRVVEIPDDLGTAFEGAPNAAARFATLSYTHRREYVRWITEAKRQATRDTRVAKTIEMLRQGVRTPASQYADEVTNGADS